MSSTTGPTPGDIEAMLSADRGASIGPYVIGFTIDFMLFGIMISQVSHWWIYGKTDKLLIKSLVTLGVLSATAVTCFNIAYMFHLFVWGYADWMTILQVDYMLNHMILSTIVITIVQVFYTSRAYALNHTVFLPLVVVAGILVSVGGAISARVIGSQVTSSSEPNVIMKSFYCWLGGTLFVDVILTVSIGYGLWRHRTGWSETRKLITKLIRITVEAQIPPTAIAIVMIILFGTNFPSAWPIGLELFHSKIYITGMLAVLNVRLNLRRANESKNSKDNAYGSTGSAFHQNTVVIQTDTEVFTHRESIKLSPMFSPNRSQGSHHRDVADVPSSVGRIEESELATVTTRVKPAGSGLHPFARGGGGENEQEKEREREKDIVIAPASASVFGDEQDSPGPGEREEERLRRARSGEEWLLATMEGNRI